MKNRWERRDRRGAVVRPALRYVLPLAVAALFLNGCQKGDYEAPALHSSLPARLRSVTRPNDNAGLRSERWLEGVDYALVHGIDLAGIDTFYVAKRTGAIERFPCSECHSVPLSAMHSPEAGLKRAHWELHLQHAPEEIMTCTTCHTADVMDSLSLLGGERISFDESYRLCGQCHATQMHDWVGGAHGKRIGGWAPPRVITPCASCHNPHDPKWGTRFPARAGVIIEE